MNILQFNVRLAEGGAAGVALDLHQRALQQGLASHFVYGYGKGGKESVSHQNYPQVIKHTPRMTAMANIALFRLFNRDLLAISMSYIAPLLVHRVRWSCIFMCCTATG